MLQPNTEYCLILLKHCTEQQEIIIIWSYVQINPQTWVLPEQIFNVEKVYQFELIPNVVMDYRFEQKLNRGEVYPFELILIAEWVNPFELRLIGVMVPTFELISILRCFRIECLPSFVIELFVRC